jgi:hypothetical protein
MVEEMQSENRLDQRRIKIGKVRVEKGQKEGVREPPVQRQAKPEIKQSHTEKKGKQSLKETIDQEDYQDPRNNLTVRIARLFQHPSRSLTIKNNFRKSNSTHKTNRAINHSVLSVALLPSALCI